MGRVGAFVSAFREPDIGARFLAVERRLGAVEARTKTVKQAEPLSSRTTFLLAILSGACSATAGTFDFNGFAWFFGALTVVTMFIAGFKWDGWPR